MNDVPAKDWAVMSEEDKYAEWSEYYTGWSGRTVLPLKTYVDYCNRWDKEYGVANEEGR